MATKRVLTSSIGIRIDIVRVPSIETTAPITESRTASPRALTAARVAGTTIDGAMTGRPMTVDRTSDEPIPATTVGVAAGFRVLSIASDL